MAKKTTGYMPDFKPFALQQVYRSINQPVYCRYCGKDIKEPGINSTRIATGPNTAAWYDDWEIENRTHRKCYYTQGRN